jgi:hypothetical protein
MLIQPFNICELSMAIASIAIVSSAYEIDRYVVRVAACGLFRSFPPSTDYVHFPALQDFDED